MKGYSLGLQHDAGNTNSACYVTTDDLVKKVDEFFSSLKNWSITAYLMPVTAYNEMIVVL